MKDVDDDILFDPTSRRLLRDGKEAKLSPKASAVLEALAEQPGQVWSREMLLERVWPGAHVGEEVLTHAIAEVRRAFGDDFRRPRFLATVHKSGYRLLCAPRRPAATTTAFTLAAYEAYLRALQLEELGGRRSIAAAIDLYKALIRDNPSFSLAHIRLAKALTYLDCAHQVDFGAALRCSAAARRLRPNCPEAIAAEGFVLGVAGEFERSGDLLTTAINQNPTLAETHYLFARICLGANKLKSAALLLARSAQLDSADFHSRALAGKVWDMLGEPAAALVNYRAALAAMEARLEVQPDDFRALAGRARCLAILGQRDQAEEALAPVAAHSDPIHWILACTYARVGVATKALDAVEEMLDQGWRHAWWLQRDPDWASQRANPRFKRIGATLN